MLKHTYIVEIENNSIWQELFSEEIPIVDYENKRQTHRKILVPFYESHHWSESVIKWAMKFNNRPIRITKVIGDDTNSFFFFTEVCCTLVNWMIDEDGIKGATNLA
ncbi:hypothetical protein ACW2QC_00940 [Virgibacillus sp. FSP13]